MTGLDQGGGEQKGFSRERQGNIGGRVRRLRKDVGLSLKQLADQAGCSESMLSKIENDRASPSLSTLHRLMASLGKPMSALFPDEPEELVMRQSERPAITLDTTHDRAIRLERLTPRRADALLQANVHVVRSGGSSEGQIAHAGEELGYVLEGRLDLTVDDQTYRLEAGDCFLFRSERPHGYRNPDDRDARVLWVNTPPTF